MLEQTETKVKSIRHLSNFKITTLIITAMIVAACGKTNVTPTRANNDLPKNLATPAKQIEHAADGLCLMIAKQIISDSERYPEKVDPQALNLAQAIVQNGTCENLTLDEPIILPTATVVKQ